MGPLCWYSVRMAIDREGKYIRTDIWREGQWLDLWSVVHFLTGAAIGFFPRYLGVDAVPAFAIVFLLLVMYEMFEAMAKIEETPSNRVMDVVVGMTSFTPAFFWNETLTLSTSILACGIILTASISLATLGWMASRKASVLEAKMHAEFDAQIEKLRERNERRKKRRAELKRLRQEAERN